MNANYPVRLAPLDGRYPMIAEKVEILINGIWGGVCDDAWDEKDARVVCNMLGYKTSKAVAVGNSVLGFRGSQGLLSDVNCVGNEAELGECKHVSFGENQCGENDHAGVLCLSGEPRVKVRPAGTSDLFRGRVEVQAFGIWGTVCDNGFGLEEVKVICRQLGYPGSGRVESTKPGNIYGVGYGPVWLSELKCTGDETAIEDCPGRPWGDSDRSHWYDVGVYCEQG